jgi:uncharacterized radical SAM superfamily protein
MAECTPPAISDVARVIKYAKSKFHNTPLYLGCMRPRKKKFREYSIELETRAIDEGINGIVLPSKTAVGYLKRCGFRTTIHHNCCAVV